MNFGVLPKILYSPVQAFNELKGVSMMQGIMMFIILFILYQLVFFAGLVGFGLLGAIGFLIAIIIGAIIGIVFLVIFGWLTSMIAGMMGGTKNMSETVGMFGYASIFSVAQMILIVVIIKAGFDFAFANPFALISADFGGLGIMVYGILGVFALWQIWIYGAATAAANNMKLKQGMITFVVSGLVFSVILYALFTFLLGGLIDVPTY